MTEDGTIIREAKVFELSRLFEFGRGFYNEMNLPGELVPSVAAEVWAKYLQVLPSVIFVAERKADEQIEGGLGAVITPDPYDGRLLATEMFWYVGAEAQSTVALRLLRAFHAWAKEQGAIETRLVHLLAPGDRVKDPERFMGLYTKLGYAPIEVNYMRKVPQEEGTG